MTRTATTTAAAGLLPVLAVLVAWWLNLAHGFDPCNPFWDGCTSVSRAVRSGPGLAWFKALAVPAAVCMALAWHGIPGLLGAGIRQTRWISGLGWVSAASFAVYAAALGGDGEFYAWMRKYGVVLYFGGCGVAQLLAASRLGQTRRAAAHVYLAAVTLSWALGVLSAFRRKLVDDPALQDRLQNALEWYFSSSLSLCLVVLAVCLRKRRKPEVS